MTYLERIRQRSISTGQTFDYVDTIPMPHFIGWSLLLLGLGYYFGNRKN